MADAVAVAPEAAPEAPKVDTASEVAKLEQLRMDAARQKRQAIGEAKRVEEQRKGLEAERQELAAFKKQREQAKLNKSAFLKSVYGDNWYDQIVEERVSGGAAPADIVAQEIQKVREEMQQEFNTREEKARLAAEEAQKKQTQDARAMLRDEAGKFWSLKGKEYPALEARWSAEQIVNGAAQFIESHWLKTNQALTAKEALDKLEQIEVDSSTKIAQHSKYAEKFRPSAPVQTKLSAAPQRTIQRQTLSNNLTASTPGRAPPVSSDEKRQRAIAAFQAARSKAPA